MSLRDSTSAFGPDRQHPMLGLPECALRWRPDRGRSIRRLPVRSRALAPDARRLRCAGLGIGLRSWREHFLGDYRLMIDHSFELRETAEVGARFDSRIGLQGAIQVFLAVEDHLRQQSEAVGVDWKRIVPRYWRVKDDASDAGEARQNWGATITVVAQEAGAVRGFAFVAHEVGDTHGVKVLARLAGLLRRWADHKKRWCTLRFGVMRQRS